MAVEEVWNGLSGSWSAGGSQLMRRFIAKDIDSALLTNPSDLLAAPFNSLYSFLPTYCSPHPTMANMYASAYSVRPWPEPDSVIVCRTGLMIEVIYQTPSAVQPLGATVMELSGSNSQWVKNRWETGDQAGQIILAGYSSSPGTLQDQIDPSSVGADSKGTGLYKSFTFDTVEIPVDSPNIIMTLTRTELNPKNVPNYMSYRRSVNSDQWLGFWPGTVVLRNINYREVFGAGLIPNHFIGTYVFEIAPDPTYIQYAVELFYNPITNKFSPNINILDGTNNGYTWVPLYQYTTFGNLGFNNLIISDFNVAALPNWVTQIVNHYQNP